MGNKPLSYADDRIGSNRSAGTFYPYGNPYGNGNAGAENQSFGTYVQDTGSGLMYAGHRYYDPAYGRFVTADSYLKSESSRNPASLNRYSYGLNDPINNTDKTGRCANIVNGITQSSLTSSSTEEYANNARAVTTYPYAGLGFLSSLGSVQYQSYGLANGSTVIAAYGESVAEGPDVLEGTQGTYWISNPLSVSDVLADQGNFTQLLPVLDPNIDYLPTDCDHSFTCVAAPDEYGSLFQILDGNPCDPQNANAGGDGGDDEDEWFWGDDDFEAKNG